MIIDKNGSAVLNPEELVTTNDPIKFKHQLLIIERVAKSAAAALCECPWVGGLLKLAMGSKNCLKWLSKSYFSNQTFTSFFNEIRILGIISVQVCLFLEGYTQWKWLSKFYFFNQNFTIFVNKIWILGQKRIISAKTKSTNPKKGWLQCVLTYAHQVAPPFYSRVRSTGIPKLLPTNKN